MSKDRETIVRTRQGAVRGRMVDGVATFKGIPYAAPPFGEYRFQPPQPTEPWDGVREVLNYGPTVVKPPYFAPFDTLLLEPVIEGTDCLNLNVWTPDGGKAGLPVMVWLHGGAFTNGTGALPTYDGSRFARDGVLPAFLIVPQEKSTLSGSIRNDLALDKWLIGFMRKLSWAVFMTD